MLRLAAAAAVVSTFALAADPPSELGGPVSGYLHDRRSGAIRPVNGIPGASILGPGLDVPAVRAAVLRTSADMAAGIGMESGALIVLRNLSRQPSARQFDSFLTAPAGIALDARGTRMAAWSKEASKLVLISSLLEEPSVSGTLDTSSLGEIVNVAVGEAALLVAASSEAGVRVYLIPHESGVPGDPAVLGTFLSVSSLLIDESGNTAWIADRSADTVFSVTDLKGAREVASLLTSRDGVSKPAAVCLSGDRLVIANGGDSTALVINISSRELIVVPLASSPTQCQRLNDQTLFAMNDAGPDPVSLVDVAQLTSYFVPADKP